MGGPLATYLASFVVAFSAHGRRILPAAEWLVPAAATLLWLPYVLPVGWPVVPLLAIELGAFGVLAVVVHGRLAQDRPAESQLTRFYLVIAAGGMLATAFVALLAPLVFPTIWEYPILLVGALVLLAVFRPQRTANAGGARRLLVPAALRLAPYALAAGVVLVLLAAQEPAHAGVVAGLLALGGVVVALSIAPSLLAIATAGVVVILSLAIGVAPLAQQRSFYGVIEVRRHAGGLAMYHGTTLHGVQLAAQPAEPTSYYGRGGPVGDLIDDLRARTESADIGVVGLGVGTIAAYAQPGDSLAFFEIDRGVVDIATDPRYFSYLADAAVEPRIVLGDGRLALRDQPPASFHLLVLDAFSSDAVPVHLLTREALALYARTIRPDGVVAFHLSNRYYDLLPAVATTARSLGLEARAFDYRPAPTVEEELAVKASRWLVVGSGDSVARFADRGWTAVQDGPILSDDFPDVMRLLRIE